MLKPFTLMPLIIISLLVCAFDTTINSYIKSSLVGEQQATKQILKLSIKLDRDTIDLRGAAHLTISLKNIAQQPIAIYKDMGWGVSSSFSKYVRDSSGQTLNSLVLSDAKDRPPFLEEDFTILKPGEEFTYKKWLDMYTEGVISPGEYVITVRYHSPVEREFAPKGLNVWAREDGTLVAEANFIVK